MDLVIIGAGGHSRDLEYLAHADKYEYWNVIGYLDDDPSVDNKNLLGDVSFVQTFKVLDSIGISQLLLI